MTSCSGPPPNTALECVRRLEAHAGSSRESNRTGEARFQISKAFLGSIFYLLPILLAARRTSDQNTTTAQRRSEHLAPQDDRLAARSRSTRSDTSRATAAAPSTPLSPSPLTSAKDISTYSQLA